MKIYIINGPNLNMLGVREPEQYGSESYDSLVKRLTEYSKEKGFRAVIYQSNHEGALVDKIQEAYFEGADAIVINPGAYTHTSIALLDAVKATRIPTYEVHISKVEEREDFRQVSYIRLAAKMTVTGKGTDGYFEAIDNILAEEKNNETQN